jgi:hypothetical protein
MIVVEYDEETYEEQVKVIACTSAFCRERLVSLVSKALPVSCNLIILNFLS